MFRTHTVRSTINVCC